MKIDLWELNMFKQENNYVCRISNKNRFLGGYFMDLKISDLPPQFENIAIELGIDKIKALFKEFGGTSVYFPTEKMIYKEARDREIISQYNGFNHKELAAKYNMSESYIRAIINRHKKSA